LCKNNTQIYVKQRYSMINLEMSISKFNKQKVYMETIKYFRSIMI
jgi:hypothetical protein